MNYIQPYGLRRSLLGLMTGNTKFWSAVPCSRVRRIPREVEYVTEESALAKPGFKLRRWFFSEVASSSRFSIR